jgi:hypothetical protein
VRWSVRDLEHQISRFLVADAQVGRLKSRPPGLALSEWQALYLAHDLAHDLAHASMAGQNGGAPGAGSPTSPCFEARSARTATSALADVAPNDEPRLSAVTRSWGFQASARLAATVNREIGVMPPTERPGGCPSAVTTIPVAGETVAIADHGCGRQRAMAGRSRRVKASILSPA